MNFRGYSSQAREESGGGQGGSCSAGSSFLFEHLHESCIVPWGLTHRSEPCPDFVGQLRGGAASAHGEAGRLSNAGGYAPPLPRWTPDVKAYAVQPGDV